MPSEIFLLDVEQGITRGQVLWEECIKTWHVTVEKYMYRPLHVFSFNLTMLFEMHIFYSIECYDSSKWMEKQLSVSVYSFVLELTQ